MKNISGDGNWLATEKPKKKEIVKLKPVTQEELKSITEEINESAVSIKNELSMLYAKHPHKIVGDALVHSYSLINNIEKIEL